MRTEEPDRIALGELPGSISVIPPPGRLLPVGIATEVGRIGGRNVVLARSLGTMRRGAITNADGERQAEVAG